MPDLRVLMAGGGRLAYFLARDLLAKGNRVTVVNRNPAESRWLARRLNATVVEGDASSPRILGEAGAESMDVVLAVTPHDEDNLVICQASEKLFGVRRTLALVNDPELETVFKALGVQGAFSLSQVLAGLLERRVESATVLNLVPLGEGEVTLTEVVLDAGTPAVGKTLGQLALPTDSLVACLFRNGQAMVPRGWTRLQPGDRLVLMASAESYAAALRLLTGERP